MGELLQLIVSGTATGAIYALAALGFTLLWQAAGTINFAQGEFVMVPAFLMLFFMAVLGAPLWAAFLLACVVAHPFDTRASTALLLAVQRPADLTDRPIVSQENGILP